MTIEEFEKLAGAIASIVTAFSIIVAGWWAYNRFIRQQENYPNLQFVADINLVGTQNEEWLVELIAIVENRGKVQHKMSDFTFVLDAIYQNDQLIISENWRGQVDFPHAIARGSFLPDTMQFFFIDPGVTAKYSYVTKLPRDATFAILHCNFTYADKRKYRHTAERTVKIPNANGA